jgi:hypothetical protein
VIGGYVYRGNVLTNLTGIYVTGDWGMFNGTFGRLFYLEEGQLKEFRIGSTDRGLGMFLKGFGQDSNGDLYVFGTTTLGPSGTTGRMLKIVSPEVSITEVSKDGNLLTIRWSGGVGPFQVQKKTSLSEAAWTDVQTVSENSIVVPIEGDSDFFQVLSQ